MLAETASRFPVRVRVVRTADARRKVLALRAQAEAGAQAAGAEPNDDDCDLRINATLLIAESVSDGEALGSVRILSSERGGLLVERLLELPAALKRQSLAEASRVVIKDGPHAQLVRLMLWKALHRYCLAAQIDTMLIAAREHSDSDYEWLGFEDALGGVRFSLVAGSEPTHRLMRLGVLQLHERMSQGGHPLHDFFFVERHPEIDLLSAVTGDQGAARSRESRAPRLPDHARIAAELAQVAIV